MRRLLLSVLVAASLGLRAGAAEHWLVAKTSHFEMYSDESESQSRSILVALEEFRANFLRVMPLHGASEPRTTVYVFSRESAFRPYLPLYEGKPKHLAGYFLSSPDGDEVLIAMTTDVPNTEQDPRSVIYHEYVHLLVDARGAHFPLWLNEGLAEVFSTFRVDHGKVVYGEPIADHVQLLQHASFLPLPRLFAVTHDSPDYNEDSRMSIFYAESWALTHYLLFGEDRTNAAKLRQFLVRLDRGGDVAASFRSAFGYDLQRLEGKLRSYLTGGGYYTGSSPALAQNIPVTCQPAAELKRDAALLDLRWRVRHNEDAGAAAFALLAKDPNQARPHELLAAIAADSGEMDSAQEHLQKAAERGSENPWVYLQLVRQGLEPYQGATMLDDRPPADLIAQWRIWAGRAWALSPENHDAIELALTVEAMADKMDLRVANHGQQLVTTMRDPARALLALAIIHWRVNQPKSARNLLELVDAEPRADMTTRATADALRVRLPPEETTGVAGPGKPAMGDSGIALRTGRLGEAAAYLDKLLIERGTTAPWLQLESCTVRGGDPAQADAWQKTEEVRTKALAGDGDAMFELAEAHACGIGAEFSPALARDWLQKAAEHGHSISEIGAAPGQVDPGLIVKYLRTEKGVSGREDLPPLDDELAARIARAASAADRSPPVVVYRPAMPIPKGLQELGGKGKAVVRLTILADGLPDNVHASEFSDPASGAAAEDFVRQWRFIPTIRDSQPIGTLAEVVITFESPKPSGAAKAIAHAPAT